MNDETPNDPAPAPTDEPKAETPPADAHTLAPELTPEATPELQPVAPAEPPAVPEAEASIEQVTAPDPEHAPEPEPAPPPELAEVAAVLVNEPVAGEPAPASGTSEALVPVEEPVTEALVPVLEPAPEPTAEPVLEPAPAPVAEAEPAAKPAKKARVKAVKAAVAVAEEPAATATATETEEPTEPKTENKKKWYAVKVQSGREDTIKSAILRKVAIEGLEEYFGEIAIPFEEVTEKKQVRVKDKKTGEYTYQEKKVTKKKKKFHGYIFANVEFNDRILYLFRETSGVGDFLNVRGSPGNPVAEPMPDHEVKAMLTGEKVKDPNKPVKLKLDYEKGDKVRIREGSFANFEGEVKAIIDAKDPNEAPKVTVVVTLWGQAVNVDLDANQVEKL